MLQSRLRPLPRKGGSNSRGAQSPAFPRPNKINGDDNDKDKDKEEDEGNNDDDDDDAEDIFSAFLPHLLPEDAPQFHGDPGQLLRYESPLYGPLTIMVPQYPTQRGEKVAADSENSSISMISSSGSGSSSNNRNNRNKADNAVDDGRTLFAHMLWSSALVAAQRVEDAVVTDVVSKHDNKNNNDTTNETPWSVKGHRVLELGAGADSYIPILLDLDCQLAVPYGPWHTDSFTGAGLPSIISVLSSAAHVTITDHPSSPAFSGAIEYNIMANVPAALHVNIESIPHEWGTLDEGDEFARKNKGRFTRIIAADCLWMVHQHENLIETLLWFLSSRGCDDSDSTATISTDAGISSSSDQSKEEGRVWVVAGFHTGRAIVAHFFNRVVSLGLEIESIYERDLNADLAEPEVRRAWEPVRAGEGLENRQRWCVIAVLKRRKENNGCD